MQIDSCSTAPLQGYQTASVDDIRRRDVRFSHKNRNLLDIFEPTQQTVSPRTKIALPMDVEKINPAPVPEFKLEWSRNNFSFNNLDHLKSEPTTSKTEIVKGETTNVYAISPSRKLMSQQYSISIHYSSPRSAKPSVVADTTPFKESIPPPSLRDLKFTEPSPFKDSLSPEFLGSAGAVLRTSPSVSRSVRLNYSTPVIPEEKIEETSEASFKNNKELKLDLDSDIEDEPQILNQSKNFVRLRAATPNTRMPSEPLIRFRKKSLVVTKESSEGKDDLLLVHADSPKNFDPLTPRAPKGVFLPMPGLLAGKHKRGSICKAGSSENVLELTAFDGDFTPPKTPRMNRAFTLAVPSEAELSRSVSRNSFTEMCSVTSLTRMQDATQKLRTNKESQLRSTVLAKRFDTPKDNDTVTSNRRFAYLKTEASISYNLDGDQTINQYVVMGEIGEGSFGKVKLARSKDDNKLYALKVQRIDFLTQKLGMRDEKKAEEAVMKEIAILKKMRHPNVMSCVEVLRESNENEILFVSEYMELAHLGSEAYMAHHSLEEGQPIPEEIIRKNLRDCLAGLFYRKGC